MSRTLSFSIHERSKLVQLLIEINYKVNYKINTYV